MKIHSYHAWKNFVPNALAIVVAVFTLVVAHSAVAMEITGRLINNAALVINPVTHKVYAVDESTDSLVVIDEATGFEHRLTVGKAPIAVALLPNLNKLYVVNTGSNSVSVIDGAQDRVITTVRGGSHPYTIAANKITNKVYVTYTYDSGLTVIDGETNTSSSLATGSADAIQIDEGTNTLFLSSYEDPYLRIVDARSGAIRQVMVGGHIWGLAFNGAMAKLYLAHTMTADVISVDEKTEETATISVGQIPCALALDPSAHRLYAVNYGDRTVSVVDTASGKVVYTIPVGDQPQAVAIYAKRNRVFVANVHGNNVTVINSITNTVLETVPIDEHPYALAVDEATGQIYAAIYGSRAAARVLIAEHGLLQRSQ